MDIIAELYEYFQPAKPPATLENQQLRAELIQLGNKVVDTLGLDVWDRITQIRTELDSDWTLEQFRAGFRLGASLMLEVFKSA